VEERGEEGFRLEREALLRLDSALTLEWLETDGRGGYASSTVLNCNRRRYHGLLVAPFPGTVRRHVFLSRLEEHVHAPGPVEADASAARSFPLSMADYGDIVAPRGHTHLTSFALVPWPRWTYRIGTATVERELLLVRGSPTVLVRWRLVGESAQLELVLRPLLACREADHLQVENSTLDRSVAELEHPGCARRLWPYPGLPALDLALDDDAARFSSDGHWYNGATYALDRERGYEDREDLFSPGTFRATLRPGRWLVLAAGIDGLPSDAAALFGAQARARMAAQARAGQGATARLTLGAEDFLVRVPTRVCGDSADRTGVVAGWPWFLEWGRDTAIALPGLLLARGRNEACGQALVELSAFLRRGLLPNIFGLSRDDSHYGSVDAALWYARAVFLYDRAGGDEARLRDALLPCLIEIAERYLEGTGLEAGSDAGGLIRAGSPTLNATWMDAQTAQGPVTPRHGCAVEINALWYQLLAHLAELCERFDQRARALAWGALARLCARSFLERLWIEDERRLADLWRDGERDLSVRPNMVLAASLELSPLARDQRAGVVERAEIDLLTPRGLRTLSPADPAYVGEYRGGPQERDAAYHQGTVWPWLFGFHVEASLRAFPRDRARRARLSALLAGLLESVDEVGLNHVSEVFDGDPPHRPGGSIAQAWNTGELLRARRMLAEGRA
jgi:predicted glycogen debranching enzyme